MPKIEGKQTPVKFTLVHLHKKMDLRDGEEIIVVRKMLTIRNIICIATPLAEG